MENSAAKNADFLKYPPCNVEWTQETGSKVWCSKQRSAHKTYFQLPLNCKSVSFLKFFFNCFAVAVLNEIGLVFQGSIINQDPFLIAVLAFN